jgi:DNA-binding beta-propeller fold protein YncE
MPTNTSTSTDESEESRMMRRPTKGTSSRRSGRRYGAQALSATLASVFLLAAFASSAQAEVPPPLWKKCPTGSGAGQCDVPRGVAVDPATGHVYVANQNNSRIEEFTPWGAFVKAWGWGVADGSPELQACGPGATPPTATCQKGLEGTGAGEFGEFGSGPQGIAVDSAGDVYVVDLGIPSNNRVQKFDSEGNFLLMFGGGVDQGPNHPGNVCTAQFIVEGDTCGAGSTGAANGQFGEWQVGSYIAVDPSDDTVYVGDQNRIQEFEPNGTYKSQIPLPGETVQSLALDPDGNPYVALCNPSAPFGACNMNLQGGTKANVLKLDQAGATLCTIEVENPTAVATDPAGGVYVVERGSPSRIRQFNSNCTDREEPFAAGEVEVSTGIAASTACNVEGVSVYVSNASTADLLGSNSFLRAYGHTPDPAVCPPPPLPPDIDDQYAVSVGADNAVLQAQINPHFWVDTTYYVEYGTSKCSESACALQPLAPGSTLKGASVDEDVTTSGVILAALQPDTTYHYRFVSQSGGGGPTVGEEETFTTFPLPGKFKTDCQNQAFRSGASAPLADCRAYEMVSPVDKNNGDISVLTRALHPIYPASLEQSSTDGDRVAYSSATAFGDALSAPYTSQYLATRKAGDAWLTHGISPPRESLATAKDAINVLLDGEYKAFSADLCSSWLVHNSDPILAPGAQAGFLNLYRRDNCGPGADGYEAITTVEPSTSEYWPELQGLSEDGSRVFFAADDKLTPDAANDGDAYQLYERSSGALHYLCVLPNGAASGQPCSAGTVGNGGLAHEGREDTVARAISEDGSRVFWSGASALTGPAPLYVRINPDREPTASGECDEAEPEKACTLQISAAAARFWTAAVDGSKAIYTVGEKLFEYNVEEQATQLIAQGALGVAGASEDASRVYFASNKVLSAEEENSAGDKAVAGKANLYLYEAGEEGEEGTIAFVGTLSAKDIDILSPIKTVTPDPMRRALRVSPDGEHLAFTSTAPLTGYDNTDAQSGEADAEVFLYDAESAKLACVSCNPTGARPRGRDFEIGGQPREFWAAAQIPTWESQLYAPRALSSGANRLFFESFEALVPRDANAKQDVYEWQRASNEKECEKAGAELFAASAGGCLSLISSGESLTDSEFADASPDGRDVFFRTDSSLLPQDPGLIDLYDAREGGGLPPPPSPPGPCEGEACQSPSAAPNDPTAASASFEGAGNLHSGPAKCRKPKVRRKGRCVASKRHRQQSRAHHRAANRHRRAGR